MDLVGAIREFRERHPRASNRQEAIQLFCCAELAKRGVSGAEIEVPMDGAYRTKKWDVGLMQDDEPRLGISCKSIISNFGGTVPNRVDDMLGEAVDLHRVHPSAILGYLFMMARVDESQATQKRTELLGGMDDFRLGQLREDGDRWFDRLVASVSKAGNRSGPEDHPEKFEVVSCSQIEFREEPYAVVVHGGALSPNAFFDRLVELYRQRFPER